MSRTSWCSCLLAAALLLPCCSSAPPTPTKEGDPLLRAYRPVLTWSSGIINLLPPGDMDFSPAVEVGSIEAELKVLREARCSCGGELYSLIHRKVVDPENPEGAVFGEWGVACQTCNAPQYRLFHIPVDPEGYDEYYYTAQGNRRRE